MQFGQINFAIWKKYILQFGQIDFEIWTNTILLLFEPSALSADKVVGLLPLCPLPAVVMLCCLKIGGYDCDDCDNDCDDGYDEDHDNACDDGYDEDCDYGYDDGYDDNACGDCDDDCDEDIGNDCDDCDDGCDDGYDEDHDNAYDDGCLCLAHSFSPYSSSSGSSSYKNRLFNQSFMSRKIKSNFKNRNNG